MQEKGRQFGRYKTADKFHRERKIERAGRTAAWLDVKFRTTTSNPYDPYRQQRAWMIWNTAYTDRNKPMSKQNKKKLTAADVVGKTGKLIVPITGNHVEFLVDVRILELRPAFGRQDLKVTPVSGSGEAFVSSKNVKEINK